MNPVQALLARFRGRIARSLAGAGAAPSHAWTPVVFQHEGHAGVVDGIEGPPLPIVRAFGWYRASAALPLRLRTSRREDVPATVFSRIHRPDVPAQGDGQDGFAGFRADFVLLENESPLELRLDGKALHAFVPGSGFGALEPHYRHFFTQDRVMGRDEIYGSGPPTDVSPEFKAFTRLAAGRVLDFGCGNGDVVEELRSHGRDAIGVELDEPRIRQALKPGARAHVVLYGGDTPLPFEPSSFDWIVSTEVIEHVPGIARYVPEFHRLLRPGGRMLVTTPDITSIPSSFPANCVPWHLLESTHINFFTPPSVTALFASHFEPVATYCLGATRINGLFVPGSIGAVFVRRD